MELTLVCRLLREIRRRIEREAPGTGNSLVCFHHTALAHPWSAHVFQALMESNESSRGSSFSCNLYRPEAPGAVSSEAVHKATFSHFSLRQVGRGNGISRSGPIVLRLTPCRRLGAPRDRAQCSWSWGSRVARQV